MKLKKHNAKAEDINFTQNYFSYTVNRLQNKLIFCKTDAFFMYKFLLNFTSWMRKNHYYDHYYEGHIFNRLWNRL